MATSKISKTLLDFANPLLEEAPTPEQFESVLTLAVSVWNAVILDDEEESDFVMQSRKLLDQVGSVELFDMLVDRKRQLFGSDRRMIGDFELVEGSDGGTNLRATAHEPPGAGRK